jgi:CubicO group peptidase (beta-lactamase class C family)
MQISARKCVLALACAALVPAGGAHPRVVRRRPSASDHARYVAEVIDQAVNPAHLPQGFKGMMVGYLDDFGPVYVPYGVATVDGTVPLNETTLFGIGSLSKLFTATLLAVANREGLALDTSLVSLLPPQISMTSQENRYGIRLLDLADHHGGLPKNEGHLFSTVNDLYADYAADPITCDPATSELIHDCGCCDPVYMSLLGLAPVCGAGVATPVYSCPTHTPTVGPQGWVYSNLGFEVLGASVATWLGYSDWNHASSAEIAIPLNMPDTMPLESFGASQIARAANHCDPATRTTNVNCQLLDWLPVGNAAGGLFSTASDMLKFLSYNAYGTSGSARLTAALPVIHQIYEQSPTGGQELAWQTKTLSTGEVEHWKDGANGPFNSWAAYVAAPQTRMVVVLDNSGASSLDLSAVATQILTNTRSATAGGSL